MVVRVIATSQTEGRRSRDCRCLVYFSPFQPSKHRGPQPNRGLNSAHPLTMPGENDDFDEGQTSTRNIKMVRTNAANVPTHSMTPL